MSTCPERDIHSVFIDGELSEPYASQFTLHLSECDTCRYTFSSLKKVHDEMSADSKKITLDDVFLEQSFQRLESRMKFRQVTGTTRVLEFPAARWSVPAVAAAVFLLAMAVPISIVNKALQNNVNNSISPVPITRASSSISDNPIIVDGNISHVAVASFFDTSSSTNMQTSTNLRNVANYATNRNTNSQIIEPTELTAIDVFKPSFTSTRESSNIRIELVPENPFYYDDYDSMTLQDIQFILKRVDSN